MKRLLLSLLAALVLPTAVNANIFNKNLTVKTNVGEKYVVKDSTVRSYEYTKSDLIKRAKESMVEYKAIKDKCYIDYEGIKSMLKVCKELDNTKEYHQKVNGYINFLETEETANVLYDGVVFTPIFENLNKQKVAMKEDLVYCIRPFLRTKTKMEIYKSIEGGRLVVGGHSAIPNPNSDLAYEVLKNKVCEKYAKFE